jgi:hypothetical protein
MEARPTKHVGRKSNDDPVVLVRVRRNVLNYSPQLIGLLRGVFCDLRTSYNACHIRSLPGSKC